MRKFNLETDKKYIDASDAFLGMRHYDAQSVVDAFVLNQLSRLLGSRSKYDEVRRVLLHDSEAKGGDYVVLLTAAQVSDLGKRLSNQPRSYPDMHAAVLDAVRVTLRSTGVLDALHTYGIDVAPERNPKRFHAALVFKAISSESNAPDGA